MVSCLVPSLVLAYVWFLITTIDICLLFILLRETSNTVESLIG